MSSRRAVSLYYGSIGVARAFRALWIAVTTPPGSAEVCRAELGRAVNLAHDTGDAAVFAFGSARSALAACLRAAGVTGGDEVVVSAYSCLAVPTGVLAAGGVPVYCDIDPHTLNADPAKVLGVVTSRTRAVVVQHTLGSMAPVAQIAVALSPRPIFVIEDCALSAGSRRDGALAGTVGDAAVFSMELSKTLSCGWGGVLFVRNAELARAVAALYATVPEPRRAGAVRDLIQTAVSSWCHRPALFDWVGKYVLFIAFRLGWFRRSTPEAEFRGEVASDFMCRMGAPQARFAALQWRDFPRVAERCEANRVALRAVLASLGMPAPGGPGPASRAVSPRVSFLVRDRADASRFFASRGIELGEWFNGPMSPLPTTPVFNYFPGAYPNAEAVARQVVNLPCHSGVSPAGLSQMISALRDYVRAVPDAGRIPQFDV